MTEQEFNRQIWRAFDTVEIEGVCTKGRVIGISFPSKSVRIAVAPGVTEWFKCTDIDVHKSATGEPDDLEMIANLHEKLMKSISANEEKQRIIESLNHTLKELKGKANSLDNVKDRAEFSKFRKTVSRIEDALKSIDSQMAAVDKYLASHGIPISQEDEEES